MERFEETVAAGLMAAMGSADVLVAGAVRFVHKDVIVARAVAQEIGASLGACSTSPMPCLRAPPRLTENVAKWRGSAGARLGRRFEGFASAEGALSAHRRTQGT
jgi:hypothetical protein